MEFVVTIATGNAAFDGDPAPELSRLLDRVSARLIDSGAPASGGVWNLYDVNGNPVGTAKWSD